MTKILFILQINYIIPIIKIMKHKLLLKFLISCSLKELKDAEFVLQFLSSPLTEKF